MIGQTHLFTQLNKFETLDDLPKSIIIVGEYGCGKHTFANEISQKFQIAYEEIDYELSPEVLSEMYALHVPTFYLIDFDKLSKAKRIERFQNTLLKFIEEPPQFAWITLLVSDTNMLLETILNRCQQFTLKPYSFEELQEIATTYNLSYTVDTLRMLHTPHNIIVSTPETVDALIRLSNLMLDSIMKATPANALSISNKFFGDNAFDLDLFLAIFKERLFRKYTENPGPQYISVLSDTTELQKKLRVMNVNKKDLIDNWVLKIKGDLSQ